LILILGYLLIIVTRVVMNVTNHRISPYLDSKTVSKLVVESNRYDNAIKQRDNFFKALMEAKEQIIESEQKNSLLRSEIVTLEQEKSEEARKLSISELKVANLSKDLNTIYEESKLVHEKIADLEVTIDSKNDDIKYLNSRIARALKYSNDLEQSILYDYTDYEYLDPTIAKSLESKLPTTIYNSFVNLKNSTLEPQFFQIASFLLSEDMDFENFEYDEEKIKRLVALNFLAQEEPSKGYDSNNILLTAVGYMVFRLSNVLDSAYSNRTYFRVSRNLT
jgi:chromosome segregation ATPase